MLRSDRDYYFTIEASFRAPELKVKGSRFIADIFPASSKQECDEHLERIRKEFYDATHHCYAYRLGIDGEYIRAADDGEPAGTAGKPILLALSSKDLTNSLLVVTRYYGGTNLGTGGLSRAYFEAAQLAINGSVMKTVYLTDSFTIILAYEDVGAIERLLAASHAILRAHDYGEKVTIKVDIRKSLSEKFRSEIAEHFYGGRVVLLEE
ncbi:MAG: YigZ family protein [Bacteroidota bacterium]|nr:YigZ family protein [Bacteroidota bacterium]MDP4231049.1 YigZ family protein [Bacteroidota bacterium]MDP4234861.1 YigZ family protein [Bacteroidota bacterium]